MKLVVGQARLHWAAPFAAKRWMDVFASKWVGRSRAARKVCQKLPSLDRSRQVGAAIGLTRLVGLNGRPQQSGGALPVRTAESGTFARIERSRAAIKIARQPRGAKLQSADVREAIHREATPRAPWLQEKAIPADCSSRPCHLALCGFAAHGGN